MSQSQLHSEPKPSKLVQVLVSDIVRITVGSNKTPFNIHEELLTTRSPFFAKALNGHFVEATTKTVDLPDDEPEAFASFISWLYATHGMDHTDWVPIEPGSRSVLELAKLWVLGDKFRIPRLQNDAARALVITWQAQMNESTWSIEPEVATYIYEQTMSDSALARLYVQCCAYGCQKSEGNAYEINRTGHRFEEKFQAIMDKLPHDMVKELCQVIMSRVTRLVNNFEEVYYDDDGDVIGDIPEFEWYWKQDGKPIDVINNMYLVPETE